MKIFVSYSQEIKDWITKLITELKNKIKNDNLDVEIIWDETHLKLGHNMHFFMENSIREADKVFIFCDTSYTQKANERNRGVGIETTIITPKMYGKVDQTKFIPVILWNCEIPDYLGGVYGIPIESREVTKNIIDKFYDVIQKMIKDKQENEGFSEKKNESNKKNIEMEFNVDEEKIKFLFENYMREHTATKEDIDALFPELNNKKLEEENHSKTNIGMPKGDISFKSQGNIKMLKKKGEFLLTEEDILEEIFNSSRDDWNVDKFEEVFTYKYNILLTIEEVSESERDFFEEWANCHPDKRAHFHEYEIKYQNKRITSFYFVSVDGYRALLPLPDIKTKKIKEKHLRLANIIFPFSEMNYEYVYRSHLEIDYDD